MGQCVSVGEEWDYSLDHEDYDYQNSVAEKYLRATIDIPKGKIFAECPAILLSPDTLIAIGDTEILSYVILHDGNEPWGMIPLGAPALADCAPNFNAEIVMDFEDEKVMLKALEDIKEGSEITVEFDESE